MLLSLVLRGVVVRKDVPIIDNLAGDKTRDKLSLLSAAPGPRDPWRGAGDQAAASNSLHIGACAGVAVSESFVDSWFRALRARSFWRPDYRAGQVGVFRQGPPVPSEFPPPGPQSMPVPMNCGTGHGPHGA